MLILGAAPSGWLDLLPGVRARFDPITRPMIRAGRRAAAAWTAANAALDPEERRDGAGDAFSAELIRRGLREWEGIGDVDGEPLAIDAEGAIELFLAEPLLFEAADEKWITPWALRASEKNGSSPSRAGTSTAATGAKITAGSAAKPVRKGGRKATAAKSAPTASTPRARTKAKRSGKSSAA